MASLAAPLATVAPRPLRDPCPVIQFRLRRHQVFTPPVNHEDEARLYAAAGGDAHPTRAQHAVDVMRELRMYCARELNADLQRRHWPRAFVRSTGRRMKYSERTINDVLRYGAQAGLVHRHRGVATLLTLEADCTRGDLSIWPRLRRERADRKVRQKRLVRQQVRRASAALSVRHFRHDMPKDPPISGVTSSGYVPDAVLGTHQARRSSCSERAPATSTAQAKAHQGAKQEVPFGTGTHRQAAAGHGLGQATPAPAPALRESTPAAPAACAQPIAAPTTCLCAPAPLGCPSVAPKRTSRPAGSRQPPQPAQVPEAHPTAAPTFADPATDVPDQGEPARTGVPAMQEMDWFSSRPSHAAQPPPWARWFAPTSTFQRSLAPAPHTPGASPASAPSSPQATYDPSEARPGAPAPSTPPQAAPSAPRTQAHQAPGRRFEPSLEALIAPTEAERVPCAPASLTPHRPGAHNDDCAWRPPTVTEAVYDHHTRHEVYGLEPDMYHRFAALNVTEQELIDAVWAVHLRQVDHGVRNPASYMLATITRKRRADR